jgi:hypothetical protein
MRRRPDGIANCGSVQAPGVATDPNNEGPSMPITIELVRIAAIGQPCAKPGKQVMRGMHGGEGGAGGPGGRPWMMTGLVGGVFGSK